jgi:filamentous hemagglutinin family protein
MKRHASMSRLCRLAWGKAPDARAAVAATTSGQCKATNRRLVTALTLLWLSPFAQAAPVGGQVVSGSGSISRSGATTTIGQVSPTLSLNWQGFNIAPGETVNFVQPSSAAIAVNRILDTGGTQILGRLTANGQVWLINPNGILFGQGAQVNVGGLVASAMNFNDASLSGNSRSFGGSGTGSVINQGTLHAADGGYVALLGNTVSNQGTITARLGTVALGAGSAATLTFSGNSLLQMLVDQSTLNNLAENRQLIEADGGRVIMTAGAKNALLASVVNNTGVIEARTVENRNGVITLLGSMAAGAVNVGGTLDASAADAGNGGFVETSAATVKVADGARITTAAPFGLTGTWLIDPVDYVIAASGGNITGAALSSNLGGGNVTILSSSGTGGTAGNVSVNDVLSWSANKLTLNAYNNISINANLNGSGTASLALQYGQGAVAAGNTSTYGLGNGAQVNLPAGNSFSTLLGSNGTARNFAVINSLGAAGDETAGPATLQGMAATANLAGNYALGGNIDASTTSTWNGGLGFAPMGALGTAFNGQFDGLGHTISGLTINRPATDFVGLFGYMSAATVSNVGVLGGSVSGHNNVGGLAAMNSQGSINNSYTTASVTGNIYVGGLAGYNMAFTQGVPPYATVSNSYATGAVTGSQNVGGLVGFNDHGIITNAYASGNVNAAANTGKYIGGLVGQDFQGTTSKAYASGAVNGGASTTSQLTGGLVGYVSTAQSSFTDVYATGSVTGYAGVGGLVGQNTGTITRGYASGAVSGDLITYSQYVGGFSGWNSGTITKSYWDTTTGYPTGGTGNAATGLSSVNLRKQASYDGGNGTWNFGTTWYISEGNTRPFLMMEYGTAIGNAHQLQLMGMDLTKSYTLASNIDMSELSRTSGMWNTVGTAAAGFVPVGSSASKFTGNFDGLGHTISGLTITRSSGYLGLFGYIASPATVANVGIEGGSITGAGVDAGGLVGYSDHGSVRNAYSSATVSTTWGFAGGLIAENIGGGISNSHASGNVTLLSNGVTGTGGLVGNNSGTITDSYASGNVTSSWGTVGGLVGYNFGGTIQRSYATGKVNGGNDNIHSQFAGGLVGDSWSGSYSDVYATGSVYAYAYSGGLMGHINGGSVTRAYATGLAAGSGGYGSGFIDFYQAGTITNSFWDKNTGKPTDESGLASGKTTAEMMTGTTFFNAPASWSTGTWTIYDGQTYPLLRSFMSPLTVTANDTSKTYNGLAYSGSGGVTYSTPPNGNLLGTAVFSSGINVGSSPITLSGLYSNQQGYIISYAPGVLTVDPATLTYTANAASRSYGAANPALSGSVSGFVAGDTLVNATTGSETYATTATASSNAGSYAINGAGLTANNGNYLFSQAAGNTTALTVNKAHLTVTADDTSRLYGAANPALATTVTGFVNGENSGTAAGYGGSGSATTLADASTNVGTATITAGAGTLAATNYSFTNLIDGTLTIDKRPLTLAATAANKIYDGNDSATVTGYGLTGLVGSQTVTGASTAATFSDNNAANGKTVTITGISLNNGSNGGLASNYSVAGSTTATADITPATLTYVAAPATFPAGQTPSGLSGRVDGLVPGDTLANSTAGTLTWTTPASATSQPGQYPINGGALMASNYVFTQAPADATALSLQPGTQPDIQPVTIDRAAMNGGQCSRASAISMENQANGSCSAAGANTHHDDFASVN